MKSGKSKKTVTNEQSNHCPQHENTLKTKTMCYQATWPNQHQFVHLATSRPQQTKLGKIEKNSSFLLPSLSPFSFENWTHIPFDHYIQSFEFHNLIKFPTLPYSWYKSPSTYLGEFDNIKITPSKCYAIFSFHLF